MRYASRTLANKDRIEKDMDILHRKVEGVIIAQCPSASRYPSVYLLLLYSYTG